MGTGFATIRRRHTDTCVSASMDRWLKKVILSAVVLALIFFGALFCITR